MVLHTRHKVKVKWSRYRPGVAQRVGRGIALLFHDRGTRRVVSVQQHAPAALYLGKDPVPILQEAGWAPGPHRDSSPDRPVRSQSLYRLSYRAHKNTINFSKSREGTEVDDCHHSDLTTGWMTEDTQFDSWHSTRSDSIAVFLSLVRPRPGKFFFHKTRARSQQIYS